MRTEIKIPKGGYGAIVRANHRGEVTILQNGFGGEDIIIFTADEARRVADALREVADMVDPTIRRTSYE